MGVFLLPPPPQLISEAPATLGCKAHETAPSPEGRLRLSCPPIHSSGPSGHRSGSGQSHSSLSLWDPGAPPSRAQGVGPGSGPGSGATAVGRPPRASHSPSRSAEHSLLARLLRGALLSQSEGKRRFEGESLKRNGGALMGARMPWGPCPPGKVCLCPGLQQKAPRGPGCRAPGGPGGRERLVGGHGPGFPPAAPLSQLEPRSPWAGLPMAQRRAGHVGKAGR